MHHVARHRHLLPVERERFDTAPGQPSRIDRIRASLDQSALDRRIASGVSTVDDGLLTVRCWQLTRPRTRQQLADALLRIIHDSDDMSTSYVAGVRTRAAHRDVRSTRGELHQLAIRLSDDVPVQAAGVARVALLVADAGGPLYVAAREPNRLWHDVHAAREALDVAPEGA